MKRSNIRKLFIVTLFIGFVFASILIIITYKLGANFKKLNIRITQFETEIFSKKKQNFPVWKTIELGSYKNIDTIREALVSNGFWIEYWANDILKKTPVSNKKNKLDLILISAAQLGFNEWVLYKDIHGRAQEFGLKFTPAEVGPQLRLQYKDQPEDEWLHVAMKPLIASDGDLTIFDILHFNNHTHNHGSSLQLCSSSVRHDVLWSPSSRWVFLK